MPPSAGPRSVNILKEFFRLPNFAAIRTEDSIHETFWLLVRAIIIFGILLVLWSMGASLLRAAWLASPGGPLDRDLFAGRFGTNGLFVLLLPVELVRGVGGVAVVCMTAGLAGALLGFLFGIPRPVSAAETPPAGAGGAPAPAGLNRGKVWQSSTNLTQVSDWLTKIIIGVGLVEVKSAWTVLHDAVLDASNWLFEMRHGSPLVIGAAVIGGGLFGFLFSYLYTDLIIARLIAATDASISAVPTDVQEQIEAIGAEDEVIGPRISRIAHDEATPTAQQIDAAMQVSRVPPQRLVSRHDVRMWARARAVLNDYKQAADAFLRLLAMPDDGTSPTDPGLLIEAARVLCADGRRAYAASLAELALQRLAETPAGALPPAGVRAAIVGDCVALRLAGLAPGGPQGALDLLKRIMEIDAALADDARLRFLRALARGQQVRDQIARDEPAPDTLPDDIARDLAYAIAHGTPPSSVRAFMERRDPPPPPPERCDDLAFFPKDQIEAILRGRQPVSTAPP